MRPTREYRQGINRTSGHKAPLRGATWRRALWSGIIALPTAILALVISDNTSIPDALRYLISPGLLVGFRVTKLQPCGGMADCMVALAVQVGQLLKITLAVNFVLYGLLFFGIATAISALKPERLDTV
jgi:hypothetical protein